jgi:RNA polymerase sigma-70 factor (sigma-E family)
MERRDRDDETKDRLAEAYDRHAVAGYRLAYLLTGDRDAAEDLLQDAFVRVAGRFRHIRFPDAFAAYLRRSIVNLHVSRLRRRRSERSSFERVARERPESSVLPDVAGRQDLWRELQALPPRQRAAIVLRYFEDLSEREAAQVMGCSHDALRSAVARGLRALRQTMGGELNERPRS